MRLSGRIVSNPIAEESIIMSEHPQLHFQRQIVLPVVATLEELSIEALVEILIEPKNALVKQYQKLFSMEGVELEIRPSALQAVAKKAVERKTGARGLRSILESVLLDTMYELPGMDNVTKVVIDENMISGDHKPLIIYADQPKVSGSN